MKDKINRLTSLLLAVCMLLGFLPAGVFAATETVDWESAQYENSPAIYYDSDGVIKTQEMLSWLNLGVRNAWLETGTDTVVTLRNNGNTSSEYITLELNVVYEVFTIPNNSQTQNETSKGYIKIQQPAILSYSVTCNTPENGTVTADPTSAEAGATVTLTVIPAEGYLVDTVSYNGIAITPVEGVYSFSMPAQNVAISATFKECSHKDSQHTSGTHIDSTQTHSFTCTVCGNTGNEACSGGTATCTEQAECQHCGASYGELGEHAPDATGKCTVDDCGYQYAAKVGDSFYETIHKALRAAEGINGCTLTLLDDVTLTSMSTYASYVNTGTFTLDLNGKNLSSNKRTLEVMGSADLTIRDSIGGGKIVSTGGSAVYLSGGKLTIESGIFEGSLDGVFLSGTSTLIVKGGTFIGSRAMITGFGSDCVIDLTNIDPAGFTLKNNGSGTFAPKLPEGYGMVGSDGKLLASLSVEQSATVHKHEYKYTDLGDGNHQQACSCGLTTGEPAGHSTGADGDRAATCEAPAYCSVCGESYGEVDKTNHDETVAYENGFCPNCDAYQPAELKDGVYQISNAGNLYWFADKVTNENEPYGRANATLTADITVNENVLAPDGTVNEGAFRVWTPIGKVGVVGNQRVEYPYTGTFDGNGKTVSGLYYHDTSAMFSVGLFSVVGEGGTVQNVGIADSYFCGSGSVGAVAGNNIGTVTDCYNTSTVSGTNYVGGVVGSNDGTVKNCYNSGTVSGTTSVGGVVGNSYGSTSTIEGCYNTGTVSGESSVGGVAGSNYGTVTGCYNSGTVSGTTSVGGTSSVGGVAGDNWTTVTGCYNTGTVSGRSQVGGVAGSNYGTVTGCYNSGTVSGEFKVGGVVGYNTGTATGCYFDSTVYTGNAIGTNDGGTVTDVEGKSTEAFEAGEVAYLLSRGENDSIWGQDLDNGKPKQTAPTFTGAKVYYGYRSCGDTVAKYTNDETVSAEKPAHAVAATYTLTEDGKKHIASYSCCGTAVTEEHNFENDAHKCVCGKMETFTVYWASAESLGLETGTSTFGQDFVQTITVPENTHLRIDDVYLRSNSSIHVNYTYENGVLTIAAKDLPAGDIEVLCDHYVEVTFCANGGVIMPHEGYPKPGDTGFAEDGSYWIQENIAGGELNPTLNAELLRTGYTFVGWRDASGKVYPMGSWEGKFVIATEDVTLYAQWQCLHTTGGVEFRDNGDGTHNGYCGECDEPLGNYVERLHVYDETTHQCACGILEPFTLHAEEQTLDVAYGSDLARALSDVTAIKIGYNHTGWTYYYLDEEGTEQPYTGTTMPAKELYAQPVFTPIEYNITWDMAGCSYYVSNFDGLPMKLAYNVDGNSHSVNFTDITAPEGYEFVRFEDGDGNVLSYVVTDKYRLNLTVSGDMTVKAVIQPKAYMATWTSVDGGGYEKAFKYGETITIPTSEIFVETFRKAGYTVAGWEGYTEGMTMPAKDVTFTAKWQINVASLAESSGTYTGKAHAPKVTVSGLTEGTDFTVTYPEDMTNVGEKTITVTGKLGGTTTVTYTIEKAPAPAIAFPTVENEITYSQQVQEAKLSFYENEYGTFNWTSPSGYPDGVGEKHYALDFYPTDLENYDWAACTWTTHGATWIEGRNALATVAQVKVNRAESIIETEPVARTLTYTGQPQELVTAGSVVGGTLRYSVNGGEWSESVPTATEAGSYYISYQVVGNSNYVGIGVSALPAVEIDKAKPQFTVPAGLTAVYGDTLAKVALPQGFTWQDATTTPVGDAGENTFMVTFTPEDTVNYATVKDIPVTITVSKQQLVISQMSWIIPENLIYSGAQQSVSLGGNLPYGVVVKTSGDKATNAGTYTATATFSLAEGYDAKNYEIVGDANPLTAQWVIAKRDVIITVKDQTITCGKAISTTEYTVTGQVDGHSVTATLTPSTAKVTANGTVTPGVAVITANGTDVAANYNVSYTSGKLVIEPDTSLIVGLTTENVTSADAQAVEAVKTMIETAESIKEEWDWILETCELLLERIESVQNATSTENTQKVEGVTTENVRIEDKENLQNAKEDLEKALAHNGSNMTVEERQAVEEEIRRIDGTLDSIEKVETAVDSIIELPEIVTPGKASDEVAVAQAADAYENLSDHEKTLVDEETKAKLDVAVAALTECDGGNHCSGKVFDDVEPSKWYHTAVDYVLRNGIMQGDGSDSFKPDDPLTRSMIVQVLYNLEGKPAVTGEDDFADTEEGAWYSDAVLWASRNGIVKGYGNGKFGPGDTLTREQMAVILCRYAEYKGTNVDTEGSLEGFRDSEDTSVWAKSYIQWAVANGIINGCGGSTLRPTGEASRAQMAQIILNYFRNK